jgi:hypothetical protein
MASATASGLTSGVGSIAAVLSSGGGVGAGLAGVGFG